MNIYLKSSIFTAISLAVLAIGNSAAAVTHPFQIGGGDSGIVITAPNASPIAGTYTEAQNVTLTADGASFISYTTDGSIPDCSTSAKYSSPIAVGSSETINAISCYSNSSTSEATSSSAVTFQYVINIPSAPDNTPPASGGSTSSGGGYSGGGGGSSVSLFSKGDSNGDGHVNILDFVTLMANWGQTGTGNAADFNGDGRVDILDFVILMANWTN